MTEDFKNYYEALEIEPNATQEEVQRAYVRARNAYAGDNLALYSLMGQDECESILRRIDEAYAILSVPEKRRQYDKVKGFYTSKEVSSAENHSSEELFSPQSSLQHALHQGVTAFNSQRGEALEQEKAFTIHQNEKGTFSKSSANSRFALNFQYDETMEKQIENAETFTGDFLRQIREYRGVDIPRMSNMTRVSKTYIKNIENEDLEGLPATVYTRGFVYQYAKCLKLNPDLVANSYMNNLKNKRNG